MKCRHLALHLWRRSGRRKRKLRSPLKKNGLLNFLFLLGEEGQRGTWKKPGPYPWALLRCVGWFISVVHCCPYFTLWHRSHSFVGRGMVCSPALHGITVSGRAQARVFMYANDISTFVSSVATFRWYWGCFNSTKRWQGPRLTLTSLPACS